MPLIKTHAPKWLVHPSHSNAGSWRQAGRHEGSVVQADDEKAQDSLRLTRKGCFKKPQLSVLGPQDWQTLLPARPQNGIMYTGYTASSYSFLTTAIEDFAIQLLLSEVDCARNHCWARNTQCVYSSIRTQRDLLVRAVRGEQRQRGRGSGASPSGCPRSWLLSSSNPQTPWVNP